MTITDEGEQKMYRHNFSIDSDYHTQRNNLLVPYKACNTTSAVMALKQANVAFTVPEGWQEEDYLTSLLQTEEALIEMKKLAPWAFDKNDVPVFPPQQVHVMLEWGINKMVGKTVDIFQADMCIRQIVFQLINGSGIVLSGQFDLPDGRELGHIVSLAGVVTHQPNLLNVKSDLSIHMDSIESFIIDDPYGDWTSSYKNHKGNDLEMEAYTFNQIFRRSGDTENKFAHIIKER